MPWVWRYTAEVSCIALHALMPRGRGFPERSFRESYQWAARSYVNIWTLSAVVVFAGRGM